MEALNGEPRDSEFQTDENRAVLDAVAFAGDALAPFFLQDPLTGGAGASFEAVAALDPEDAAAEWPFAEEGEAREALGLMVAGLAGGVEGVDGGLQGGRVHAESLVGAVHRQRHREGPRAPYLPEARHPHASGALRSARPRWPRDGAPGLGRHTQGRRTGMRALQSREAYLVAFHE